ncbi:hypothetical protein N7470_005159 [Penicillium chermesinum]|nr:hypothetical protein N7470_005159 [Penicillium chermesinum]
MEPLTNSDTCPGIHYLDVRYYAEYIGSTKSVITRMVNRAKASTTQDTIYVKFTNVSPEIARSTDIKATRNFYDLQTRRMIITITGGPHERVTREWDFVLRTQAIASNLAVVSDGSARMAGHSSHKEPDSQYMPEDDISGWPTVVLEVGYSESPGKLKCDAAWWLANSNGEVKLVITIAIDKRQPQITIECIVLDNFILPAHNNRPHYRTVTRQHLTITRRQGIITTRPSVPLRITVQEIMGRSPLPGETDILIPVPRLEELAAKVWFRQRI